MKAEAPLTFERVTNDTAFPAVRPDLMKLGWERYLAGIKSPAPTDERRFMRATSRLRYAVRADWKHQGAYVVRCNAFIELLLELGATGLGEWQTPSEIPNLSGFHDAVFDAVATVPLRGRKARFGRVEFLAAVKKIAQDKYGH